MTAYRVTAYNSKLDETKTVTVEVAAPDRAGMAAANRLADYVASVPYDWTATSVREVTT